MADVIEAAKVDATVARGAVKEPPPWEAAEGSCLNCGAVVQGAYCAGCGQKAHLHRTVPHAIEEMLHGVIHFDGRFWNTLPLLLFRPGKLTRDYIEGRRARYITPVATFLLTMFLMFLLFGFLSGPELPEGALVLDPKSQTALRTEADAALADIERQMAEARADPLRAGELAGLEVAHAAARATRARLGDAGAGTTEFRSPGGNLYDVIRKEAAAGNITINTGNPQWDALGRKALTQPEFAFYKMKQKGYKLSFLLVPLSLPWLALIFLGKRGVHVYDHVVFLLYSISFMSLLLMLGVGLVELGVTAEWIYVALFWFAPPLHIFLQLKEGYALSLAGTMWRTVLLWLASGLTLLVYLVLILALGIID